jgi:hypothetical protein
MEFDYEDPMSSGPVITIIDYTESLKQVSLLQTPNLWSLIPSNRAADDQYEQTRREKLSLTKK